MAVCRVCAGHIERQGEVEGATVADGDRPWVIVQPELDPETGIGDDIIDDGSHQHQPARAVVVHEYGGAGKCWRCDAEAGFTVGRWLTCDESTHLATAVRFAVLHSNE